MLRKLALLIAFETIRTPNSTNNGLLREDDHSPTVARLGPVKPSPGVPGVHLKADTTVSMTTALLCGPGASPLHKVHVCSVDHGQIEDHAHAQDMVGNVAMVKKWRPRTSCTACLSKKTVGCQRLFCCSNRFSRCIVIDRFGKNRACSFTRQRKLRSWLSLVGCGASGIAFTLAGNLCSPSALTEWPQLLVLASKNLVFSGCARSPSLRRRCSTISRLCKCPSSVL